MKNLFILLLTTVCFTAAGQNLVPNPSFEIVGACPSGNELVNAIPWENSNTRTPDIFNECLCATKTLFCDTQFHGSQNPHSGLGFAGIYVGAGGSPSREYLQVKLLKPLTAGKKYEISYYVSLADYWERAIDRMGVYFSTSKVFGGDQLPFTPQVLSKPGLFLSDKVNWMLVKDTMVASGGENYMTVGNFFDEANTNFIKGLGGKKGFCFDCAPSGGLMHSYYFFDDFSVIELECELPTVDLGNDTLLCLGSSIALNAKNEGATYIWNTGETAQSIDVNNSGVYSVEVTDTNGCKGEDTIVVGNQLVPVADFSFSPSILYPAESAAHFSNQSSGASHYQWKFGSNGTKGNPSTSNNENETSWFSTSIAEEKVQANMGMDSVPVTLIVSNDYCVDSITKIILINDIFTLFVPNAFSPNGDGVNDEFFPSGLNINCDVCKNFEFMVFDRWGEMIFYSNNNHAKWNGKRNNNLNDVQEDIYVWKVIYTNIQKGNKGEQMGMVTVVR